MAIRKDIFTLVKVLKVNFKNIICYIGGTFDDTSECNLITVYSCDERFYLFRFKRHRIFWLFME